MKLNKLRRWRIDHAITAAVRNERGAVSVADGVRCIEVKCPDL